MNKAEIENHPDFEGHEVVEYREAGNLKAFIAVHNSNLGPAVGGCRMFPYATTTDALTDLLRLSRGMTYKSALANLPLGGGKAVIIGNPRVDKHRDLLLAMGDFIASLDGRYITAEDSGTSAADMQVIRERTKHVSGVEEALEHGGDPSPSTAYGIFIGIQAAVQFRLGREDLGGIKVAIQGVGSVGFHLAQLLADAGAEIFVADIHEANVNRTAEVTGAQVRQPQYIHSLDVDVYSPCAMGGVINDNTLPKLQTSIIAGGANNQLLTHAHGVELHRRGVLYVPDYVINAGGIIDICYQHLEKDRRAMRCHVESIGDTVLEILHLAEKSGRPTNDIADELAEVRFSRDPLHQSTKTG